MKDTYNIIHNVWLIIKTDLQNYHHNNYSIFFLIRILLKKSMKIIQSKNQQFFWNYQSNKLLVFYIHYKRYNKLLKIFSKERYYRNNNMISSSFFLSNKINIFRKKLLYFILEISINSLRKVNRPATHEQYYLSVILIFHNFHRYYELMKCRG